MHIETPVYKENQHLPEPPTTKERFWRTTMNDEHGKLISARINLETGEIKPYRYRKGTAKPKSGKSFKPRRSIAMQKKKAETASPEKKTRRKKCKELENKFVGFTNRYSLRSYLDELDELDHVSSMQFENIILGVSYLEDGKEEPFSPDLFFKMLRDMPVFTTKAAIDYTGRSKRHCQKLCNGLRCIHKAIEASGCISVDFAYTPVEGGYIHQTGILPDETVVEFDGLMYAEFLAVQEQTGITAQEFIARVSKSASTHIQDSAEAH